MLTDDRDLGEPSGIFITDKGMMYVANTGDDNILSGMMPASATEMRLNTFASGLSQPYDVTTGALMEPNNHGTCSITFAPDYSQDGITYPVTVSALDGQSSALESFSVITYNVNRPPMLDEDTITDTEITVDAGTLHTVSLISSDADSDAMRFDIVQQNNPPSFVTILQNNDMNNPVSFGAVDPTNTSAEHILQVRNTGNVDGSISVSATPWVDDAENTLMNSETTRVSVTTGDYDSKKVLNGTTQNIGVVATQSIMDMFIQLQTNLVDPLFSGELTQDIEVSLTC